MCIFLYKVRAFFAVFWVGVFCFSACFAACFAVFSACFAVFSACFSDLFVAISTGNFLLS